MAAVLLLALPAGAHPFVRGGEAPVDSVATFTLAMGHGCGTEDSGGGDPTLEVALEVPGQMRVVEVAEDPSYDHAFEVDEDGRIEVITWSATGEGEPAPDVEFDAVLSGEVGDEVFLRVFQGCADFGYRWIGTPDEPADDPAVRITLVEADAAAPPPAPDEPTPAEAQAAPEPDEIDEDPLTEEEGEAGAAEGGEADTDLTDDPADEGDATDDETSSDLEATDAAAEDGGGFPWVVLVAVAVALAALGIVLARRSGGAGRADTSGPGGP